MYSLLQLSLQARYGQHEIAPVLRPLSWLSRDRCLYLNEDLTDFIANHLNRLWAVGIAQIRLATFHGL
jgi:hypothetical protein